MKPKTMKVHPKFKQFLHLEAATHGQSIIKYTEKIANANTSLDELAKSWKEKYGGKTKKKDNGFLDFP